jgi:predicted small metal-binding protein
MNANAASVPKKGHSSPSTEATGNTSEEVVKKASVHAMEAHRAEAMRLASKVRDAIKKP